MSDSGKDPPTMHDETKLPFETSEESLLQLSVWQHEYVTPLMVASLQILVQPKKIYPLPW